MVKQEEPLVLAVEAIVFQDFNLSYHHVPPLELIDHEAAPGIAHEVDVGIPYPILGDVAPPQDHPWPC